MRRFCKNLTKEYIGKIESATTEQLEFYAEKLLDAKNIDEIFESYH